jgi:hypothetical protein
MAAPPSRRRPSENPPPAIPPLENGDRLTRDEFERRYDAMPNLKKAELIEGVVHLPSPVRFEQLGEPHADLMGWLGVYRVHTAGVRVGGNSTVRLDLENEPQPDAVMIIDPALGGKARIDSDGYLELGPEWVGEVAASSAGIDLHDKFRVYMRSQAKEYLVWRVLDQEIDWFVLRSDHYERLQSNAEGIYASEVFPGLWLDAAALVHGDLLRVHAILEQGLASPEHAAFVARLQRAAAQKG